MHAQRKCPARVSSYPQELPSPAQMTAQPGHSAPLQVGVGLAPARPRLSPPRTKNAERGHHPHRQPARTPRQPRRRLRSPEQGRQAGQRGQHYHRSHHAPRAKLVARHAFTPSRPLACVLNMPEPRGRGCRNARVADSVAVPGKHHGSFGTQCFEETGGRRGYGHRPGCRHAKLICNRQARQCLPPRADPTQGHAPAIRARADVIEPPCHHHHHQRDQSRRDARSQADVIYSRTTPASPVDSSVPPAAPSPAGRRPPPAFPRQRRSPGAAPLVRAFGSHRASARRLHSGGFAG